jgi:hypothetical protein
MFALMPECLPAGAMPETNFRRSIPRCINRLPQALSQDQITFLEYLKLILHEDRPVSRSSTASHQFSNNACPQKLAVSHLRHPAPPISGYGRGAVAAKNLTEEGHSTRLREGRQ